MRQVVLLHGGVINRHMWSLVIDELVGACNPVAIDLPAHGERAGERWTMDASVDAVGEIAEMGCLVVGLSLGGYVAQAFAIEHPTVPAGLVLSGSTIAYTGWDGLVTRFYGALFPLVAGKAAKTMANKMTEDFSQEFVAPILESGLNVGAGGQVFRRLPGRDYAAELRSYPGRVVIANGERDEPNRKGEKRFSQLHPHSEIRMIEDAGHACALQQPVAFAEVVKDLLASIE